MFFNRISEDAYATISPPANISPLVPIPPLTIRAPEVLLVEAVVFVIVIAFVVDEPSSVTLCNVLVIWDEPLTTPSASNLVLIPLT